MITLVIAAERNRLVDASIGVDGEVVFCRKVVTDPDDPYPYTVTGHDNFLVRFLTYDGARFEIMKQVTNMFNRLHDEALAGENARDLQRFIDEIAPPA